MNPFRILDRYVIRETALPALIGLLVFTFVLLIPPILNQGEQLIVKGASWGVAGRVLLLLVPQGLGITIPMALLLGLLIAFGRLSADREAVALQACGVSLYRLLRPAAVISLAGFAATLYVMIVLLPDSNQAFRELTFKVVTSRAQGDVKPRVFFEDFPGKVLYVRDVDPAGGLPWRGVFVADTQDPNQPVVYVAREGGVAIDAAKRTIQMTLVDGWSHRTHASEPQNYDVSRFGETVISLDPDSVFPREGPMKGDNEMTIAELRQRIAEQRAKNDSTHNQEIAIHQKFSIPVACLVFGIIATALGVTTRRDGKLASFVLGICVVFAYYVVLYLPRALAKGGQLSGPVAAWLPNVVIGLVGIWLLVRQGSFAERPIRIPLPFLRRREAPAPAVPGGAAPARPAERRVVVVIRIPQFALPRPKLIDLYVTRLSLRIIGLALFALLGLFYISSFVDLSEKLFKGTATGRMVLQYLWFSTPEFLYFIIPMSILIATLVTVGGLTKSSELIVMRACGVSLYRVAAPLLLIALGASSVLFLLEERVLGYTRRRSDEIQQVIRGRTPRTFNVLNQKWIVSRDGNIYHYAYFDPRRREMTGLSIFSFDPRDNKLARRTDVKRAVYTGAAADPALWRGKDGWTREFAGDAVRYAPALELDVKLEEPEYFMTERPEAERMSYTQLRDYIRDLRTSGLNVLPSTVALYRKLAFPFVTIIMTLIAVPFAVTTGRRGALYGIGVGIVLAIVYWVTISIFAAIGSAGLISPILAAWVPNLLFGAAAGYLLLTVRT